MEIHEKALEIMNEAGRRGIRVDVNGMRNWVRKSLADLVGLQYKIHELTGIEKPGSSKQVAKWLDGLEVRGTGSAQERLQMVTGKNKDGPVEASELIGRFRTLRKSTSSAQNILDGLMDDRIYSKWKLSEKTNRLYSGIQNLSVDIRDFLLPEEDHVIVVMDYKSQELRILLHETGEIDLLKSLDENDFHGQMASLLFEISEDVVTDDQREDAKSITYAIPYGQDAHGLSYRKGITEVRAQGIIDRYFEIRPGLKHWLDLQMSMWEHSGRQVQTKLGHIRKDCPEGSVINTKIQGSAADVLCGALERVGALSILCGALILVSVHDSIVFSVPLQLGTGAMQAGMERTDEYGHMPVSVKTGATWGEAHRAKDGEKEA